MTIDICVLILMLTGSMVDIRKQEVPIWALGAGIIISGARIAIDSVTGSFDPVGIALSLIPGAAFLILALVTRQGVGYGDGLMLLCIGPAFGLYRLALGLFISLFICSLFSGILLLMKRAKGGTRIPYIPFLTIGMGAMIFAQV
ncbi:prepilin peptidase [Butyrivibrio sp. AE2032]|uniref:prepilin peptidase n=1 Tax=Butyrivibrio sp. AE2032 TaxID=1458463 RepID=UPI00068A837A|nr:prepilin peptidase [Butyrivibrio sp. AE2032]